MAAKASVSGEARLPHDRRMRLRDLLSTAGPLIASVTVAQGSAVAVLLALGRLVDPASYGAAAAVLAILLVCSLPGAVLVALGTEPVGARGPDAPRGRWSRVVSRIVLPVGGLSIVLLAGSPAIAGFLDLSTGVALLLAASPPLAAASGAALGLVWGRRGSAAMAAALAVGVPLRVVGTIGLLQAFSAPLSVILGTLLADAVLLVLALPLLVGPPEGEAGNRDRIGPARGATPGLGRTEAVGVARTSMLAGPATVAGLGLLVLVGMAHLDLVLARHYLDPTAAGKFAAAGSVARVLPLLVGVALLAVLPSLRSLEVFTEPDQWLRGATAWVGSIAVIGWLALILLRGPLLGVLFGNGFEGAADVAPVLGAAGAFNAVSLLLVFFHAVVDAPTYVLTLAAIAVEVVLAAFFHATGGELGGAAVAGSLLAVVLLYQAASSICRWSPPLAALTPHEEVSPAVPEAVGASSNLELSLVLPCHNAGPALREFLRRLQGSLLNAPPHEVIVVSDGSTDDTVRVASEFASETLRVFHYPDRSGKGHALRVGLNRARGEYVAFIDSDGDIDPEAIGPFLSIMKLYGPDVVLASKRHPLSRVQYPPLRRVMSWVYHKMTRLLFRVNVRDTQTGLKLIRKEVLAAVLPRMLEKRYAFDLELLVVARMLGFDRVFEAPVSIQYQFTSNVNPRATLGIILDTVAIFYRRYVLNTYRHAGDRLSVGGVREPHWYRTLFSEAELGMGSSGTGTPSPGRRD